MRAFRRRLARVTWMGVIAGALAVPSSLASAAAPNQLSSPSVSPASGDTTTTFSFAVHYVGRHPATSVSVTVGPTTVALTLTAGSTTDGTYSGSSHLAAGSWPVTFNAVATQANSPTISGATVTVAGPAPQPTAVPVAPAPVATAKPAAPTSVATITGGGGSAPQAQATPVPEAASTAPTAQPAAVTVETTMEAPPGGGLITNAPGARDLVPQAFWPIMLAGFGVIGLFVAYYIFAMNRDRRRQAMATELALATQRAALVAPTVAEPERAPAVWELDARLEDAPIGTVEYLPLENGAAIGSLPEDLSEPERRRRGNPRLARMTDARQHRFADDRRTLLRRG